MMKINLAPIDKRCPITICKPSRRYRNVSLTTRKIKRVNNSFTAKKELVDAMDRMVDNRLFKI